MTATTSKPTPAETTAAVQVFGLVDVVHVSQSGYSYDNDGCRNLCLVAPGVARLRQLDDRKAIHHEACDDGSASNGRLPQLQHLASMVFTLPPRM